MAEELIFAYRRLLDLVDCLRPETAIGGKLLGFLMGKGMPLRRAAIRGGQVRPVASKLPRERARWKSPFSRSDHAVMIAARDSLKGRFVVYGISQN